MRSPHIPFAHHFWENTLSPQDFVIDATCGNGHDTLALARIVHSGKVFAYDLQEAAIEKTRQKLIQEGLEDRVKLFHQSHEAFEVILPESIQLIVYNLGYLPGGDKSVTTKTSTTLKSLKNALPLLKQGGILFMTLYPGHPEGLIEAEAVKEFAEQLPKEAWSVHHERFSERITAPRILYALKTHNGFVA